MASVFQIIWLDVAIGVASHYLWFKRYEPTSYSAICAVVLLVTSPIVYILHPLVSSIFRAFLLAESIFIAAVLASVVWYRLSPFHPLASCPGPVLCKVTKLWSAYVAWTGKPHRYYAKLHQIYGPIVRIGPNDVSVTDKDLFPHILGAQGMPKGPVWDNRRIVTSRDTKGHKNLHAVRDLKLHGELRKPWNKAFAKEPMKDYEAVMVATAQVLVERLQEVCREGSKDGVVVNGARWMSYYSFDFMGDMVYSFQLFSSQVRSSDQTDRFGRNYDLLKHGDPQGVLEMMRKSMTFPSIAQHVSWISGFTKLFPSFTRYSDAFRNFAATQAKMRAGTEPLHKDLFFHLIDNTDIEPGVSVLPLIMADAALAIFAGSDTTSTMLSNVLFYLAVHSEWQDRVRKEVDDASRSVELPVGCVPVPDALAELRVMNAVINETLRMQPAVPSLLQRAPTFQGGKQLGDLFLPEGNSVQVPPYAVHRDPRYFSPRPTHFWPERWLASSDSANENDLNSRIVLDRSAFIPFSTGPASCAGKNIALKQMRYVVALFVRKFHFELAEGYDPDRWEDELEDRFLLVTGELPIRLSMRSA